MPSERTTRIDSELAERRLPATRSADSATLLLLTTLLATPLYFVKKEAGGFIFAPLLGFDNQVDRLSFGIPIAIFGLALLGLVWLTRTFQRRLTLSQQPLLIKLTLALATWMTAVAIYGMWTGDRPVVAGGLYAQTIAPLLIFLAVLTLPKTAVGAKRALLAIPIVGSASVLVLLAAGRYFLVNYPPQLRAFAFLAETFYSAKNVHPVIVVAGLAILLAQFSTRRQSALSRWALWLMLFIHASYLLIIWSRAGLVMIGLVVLLWLVREIWYALRSRELNRRFWLERVAILGVMLAFGSLSVTYAAFSSRMIQASISAPPAASTSNETLPPQTNTDPPEATPPPPEVTPPPEATPPPAAEASETLPEAAPQAVAPPATTPDEPTVDPPISREETQLIQQRFGDNRRIQLLLGGLELISENPIVGAAFNPLPAGSSVFGISERDHKLYPSHNQFVDFAVRTGVPGLLFYIALLAGLTIHLWKKAMSAGRGTFQGEMATASLTILVVVAAGSMFQAYFVVTQPAVLVFTVVGIALSDWRAVE